MESNKSVFLGSHVFFFLTDGEISLRTEQQKRSLPLKVFHSEFTPETYFFLYFHPQTLGKMFQCDGRAYFSGGLVQPPSRKRMYFFWATSNGLSQLVTLGGF